MKPKLFFLLFICSFLSFEGFANQDFSYTVNFGKSKYSINSEIDHEGLRKMWIISRLVNKISEHYHYHDTIIFSFPHKFYFDFDRYRVNRKFTLCFISYDNKTPKDLYDGMPYSSKKKMIIITQFCNEIDIEKTLRLTEYAIANYTLIEKNQKTIFYKPKGSEPIPIVTIDTLLTKQISLKESSAEVKKIFSNKIRVPYFLQYANKLDYSYYFQNKKYFVIYRKDKTEKPLLTLNSIQRFISFENKKHLMVFENDSTFYFVNGNTVSKKITINQRVYNTSITQIEEKHNGVYIYFDRAFVFELGIRNNFEPYPIWKEKWSVLLYRINKQDLTLYSEQAYWVK